MISNLLKQFAIHMAYQGIATLYNNVFAIIKIDGGYVVLELFHGDLVSGDLFKTLDELKRFLEKAKIEGIVSIIDASGSKFDILAELDNPRNEEVIEIVEKLFGSDEKVRKETIAKMKQAMYSDCLTKCKKKYPEIDCKEACRDLPFTVVDKLINDYLSLHGQ